MTDKQIVDWLDKNAGSVQIYCRENTVIVQIAMEYVFEGESLREAISKAIQSKILPAE